MDKKQLTEQIGKLSADAKKLYGEMAADEAKRTPENRETLQKMIDDGQALKSDLKMAEEVEALEKFATEPAHGAKAAAAHGDEPQNVRIVGPNAGRKSWGQGFTESAEYKQALKNNFSNPNVSPVEVKAIYEGTEGTGGALVFSQRVQTPYDLAPTAPTTLLDIMNTSQTNGNSIDFVQVTGFTNSAAEVSEYTGGNFGAKPESNLTFNLENAPVQTIAHWVPASRNILADAPALRNLIDRKMTEGLRRRLEGQVVAGNGTAPNLRGILNTTGIQTRDGGAASASARYVAGDTILDTVRRAITDVALAFGQADAIVVNPADGEKMELQKDDNNNYMNVYDPVQQRVWRVRVVENLAITANEAIVGDFSVGATLFIRENAVIRVSESHSDFFIRNAIVILAEMRAALAVTDPEMFVHIDTLT